MKKIDLWKVIVLSIVTFGIYPIVWFAKRRGELVSNYQLKVPHWLWLVLPISILMVLVVPILVVSLLMFYPDNMQAYGLWAMLSILALVAIAAVISIWWVYRFSVAIAKVIEGRVPASLAIWLYIFWGFGLIVVHQFYVNRHLTEKAVDKSHFVGPSTKFKIFATIAIILGIALTFFSGSTTPGEFQKLEQDMKTLQTDVNNDEALLKRANDLTVEYQNCTTALEINFPEVTIDNEAAYNAAYAQCDEIREEQHQAANAYNKVD